MVTAEKYDSKSGVMAFDDFRILNEKCPPVGNCDFEQADVCSWSQDMLEDEFDWTLGSGHTPGLRTGPHVDHTTNTTGGKSLFETID